MLTRFGTSSAPLTTIADGYRRFFTAVTDYAIEPLLTPPP
jgi:hypothetical protein